MLVSVTVAVYSLGLINLLVWYTFIAGTFNSTFGCTSNTKLTPSNVKLNTCGGILVSTKLVHPVSFTNVVLDVYFLIKPSLTLFVCAGLLCANVSLYKLLSNTISPKLSILRNCNGNPSTLSFAPVPTP